MTLTERVITQARIMAPGMSEESQALLEAVCRASVASLRQRLKDNLTPEDCLSDFVTAAGLHALSALSGITDVQPEQITAGDLSIRRGSTDAASVCLRAQAELLMAPYLAGAFEFRGV